MNLNNRSYYNGNTNLKFSDYFSFIQFNIVMRYIFILLILMSCTRDVSFDPTVTISKEIIKFLYNESNKEEPVVE